MQLDFKSFFRGSTQWSGYILGGYILITIFIVLMNLIPLPSVAPSVKQIIHVPNPKEGSVNESSKSPTLLGSLSGEVTRKTRVERGGDYVENIFYLGNQEIADQKCFSSGNCETKGQIPDGKVKFFDEYQHAHGEEYYHDGKKEGVVKTFFEDEQLRSEAYYQYGKLQKNKEFFKDGKVRFEVDYEDAWDYKEGDKEVGIGKLYYSDGTLKYEWNMTKSNPKGFKKTYDRNGELRYEAYYDQFGELIGSQKYEEKEEQDLTQAASPQVNR